MDELLQQWMLKFRATFWTPFPGHHNNLKCFPHSRKKQWWRGEKSAVFSGYSCLTSTHSRSTIFCSGLQGAVKSDAKKAPPPWIKRVLFLRCPYYLRALHRLVNNALMYLKKTNKDALTIAFVRTHPNLVSCGTKAEIFQLSRATAN